MDPRAEMRRHVEVDLPEEVRQTATGILRLLDTTALPAEPAANVRATCEGARRRLSGTRLTVAFVGDAGVGRRTLYNAMLGERVLATGTPRRGSTVTIVRRAPLGFVAHSLEGRCVAHLARKMPDRDALFSRSMDQIKREVAARGELVSRLEAARAQADALQTSIAIRDDLGRSPAAAARPELLSRTAVAMWSWLGLIRSWIARIWIWLSRHWQRVLRATKRFPQSFSGPANPPSGAAEADGEPTRLLEEEKRDPKERLRNERDAIAALERELNGLTTAEQIEARMDRLRLERETYDGERRAALLSLVRDVDGTDIAERIIEYPAGLSEDLTLVDLPCPTPVNASIVGPVWSRAMRETDALVLVADIQRPPANATAALIREVRETAPLVLIVLTKADKALADASGANGEVTSRTSRLRLEAIDRVAGALGLEAKELPCVAIAAGTIGSLSDRLNDAKPAILALREAMRVRTGAAEFARAGALEEESCRKRLAALEGKPIPDPAAFRERLMSRVESAIATGADEVFAAANKRLHDEFEALRAEWQQQIVTCVSREDVDACAKAINESARQRISDVLERTVEQVARELQELSESLERWTLDEVHTQYQLVRRLGFEALTPLASELTREDLEQERSAMQPGKGAFEAFERQRVGLGLRGVAAGAALGTLIAPGIGTAVGAVIGVLAGLLKGIESLRQECLDKTRACLDGAERHAHAQLAARRTDLSRVVRITLDEALDAALTQLGDAIERLRVIEKQAIERERAKMSSLSEVRLALEKCDANLASLMARASRRALGIDDADPKGLAL
jgi:GTP-binding protein EngB required for normal cell division